MPLQYQPPAILPPLFVAPEYPKFVKFVVPNTPYIRGNAPKVSPQIRDYSCHSWSPVPPNSWLFVPFVAPSTPQIRGYSCHLY